MTLCDPLRPSFKVCKWDEGPDASTFDRYVWPRLAAAAETFWSPFDATRTARSAEADGVVPLPTAEARDRREPDAQRRGGNRAAEARQLHQCVGVLILVGPSYR